MKISIILYLLLYLTISSCQNELYENAVVQQKVPFKTNTVSLNDIPEIEALINQNLGDLTTGRLTTSKSISQDTAVVFETHKIIEVVDTLLNKNYSIRFTLKDSPENVTYNLIVNIQPNNTENIFVEKYTCNVENFPAYKNSMYSFDKFKGRVDLYVASNFFSKSTILNKITSKDPCLQLTYPNGDPVPTSSSFINGQTGESGSSSGGGSSGSYDESTYGYGVTNAGWSSYLSGASDTSLGGTTGNGCCSCGDCGTHYYPPSDRPNHTSKIGSNPCEDIRPVGFITLNAEPEVLYMLRQILPMTVDQWQWLHGKDHIAFSLLEYVSNTTTTNAKRNAYEIIKFGMEENIQTKLFPLQMLGQMKLNPNLIFDVRASYFSPYYIDINSISKETIEGKKFNSIYKALLQSPSFKMLFVEMFANNTKFNVKFEIDEHVYENNDPTKKEINATTSQVPGTNNIVIKINKQILMPDTSKSRTDIENAKTILHESIHAYLFAKASDPSIGADYVKILNTMYPTYNEQHDFMYNQMIPTMQKVLYDIRDFVTTSEKRNVLETQYTMHPTTNPLTSTSWIWSEYFKFLCINGLEETTCFVRDFPKFSDQLNLLGKYIEYGHKEL